MRDLYSTFRRAFGLASASKRKQLWIVGILGVAVSALEYVGLILLVPLLGIIASGSSNPSRVEALLASLFGTQSPEKLSLYLAIAAALVFLAKGAASVGLLWWQTGIVNGVQVDLSARLLRSFALAPWLEQKHTNTGGFLRTASGAVASVGIIITAGIGVFSDIAVFVAIFAAMVAVDAVFALAVLGYIGIAGVAFLMLVKRPTEKRGRILQDEVQVMNSSMIEIVRGVRDISLRGVASTFVARYVASASRANDAGRLIAVISQGMRFVLESMTIIGAAVIIVLAYVTQGSSDVVIAVGVMLAGSIRLLPAFNGVLLAVNQFRANGPALQMVEVELERLESSDPGARCNVSDSTCADGGRMIFRSMRFANVGLRYPGQSENALTDVTLEIERGASVGVVGATGSGKSTLVDIMLGQIPPTHGTVTIDGFPISEVRQQWQAMIGFVPQDVFITDGSLRDNVAFGIPSSEVDESQVLRALDQAHLGDVVTTLPGGIDGNVGEGGARLSGGQIQRIALARALYSRPEVLILDEATSALDNETEFLIGEAIRKLGSRVTLVVVAHRLSTVRLLDRIHFFNEGTLESSGTFDELMRQSERFARLVELGDLGGDLE